MPGYDSRPLVRKTELPANRPFKMGDPCPRCGLIKPAGWAGVCRYCREDRRKPRPTAEDEEE